ncbi:hypothetical protein [Roseibium algae]|uniref:Uncharacterized protein n=1 Tax=Roseibium algae TaxID=3123038 RepID=A0ABU8TRC8_9HYPH
MSEDIFSVSYTVVSYNVGGAQGLTTKVTPGDVLSGKLSFFPNVSGGSAEVNFVFWKDGQHVGDTVPMNISQTDQPTNHITVPENVDMAVMTFGNVTFPAGSVTISLSRS